MSGLRSYLAGKAAEESVVARYAEDGYRVLCRRWRGPGGEIDLVLSKGDVVVFVEVKSAPSWAEAVARLSRRQIARLMTSAEAGLGFFRRGSLTEMRFDVALVDRSGRIDVLPNALMAA